MPDFVRRIVSGPKARYVDQKLGVDLDLVYVTDRLIIMGWPASSLEALYRNSRKDVRKFLESRHGKKYRVYNLCPCSENSYEAEDFHGSVSRYPFPDHHPPPLSMIPMFVADMTAWFAEDPCNVAVIHCKAGKGRSGTMACSYLLSLPKLPPPPQSKRNFGNKYDREQFEALKQAKSASKTESESAGSTPPNGTDTPGSEVGNDTVVPNMKLQIDTAVRPFPLIRLEDGNSPDLGVSNDEKLEELAERLKAVFEFHTSRRLKPPKSTASSATSTPLRSRKSSFNKTTSGNGAEASSTPLRKRSMTNIAQTFRPGFASPPKIPSVQIEGSTGSPRLRSKSNVNLRALGASPAGRSEFDLSIKGDGFTKMSRSKTQAPVPSSSALSINSFVTVDDGVTSSARRGSFPLTSLENGSLLQFGNPASAKRVMQNSEFERTTRADSSLSNHSDDPFSPPFQLQQDDLLSPPPVNALAEGSEEEQDEVIMPRLAVSIPSQRRWVGYWARMLAGLDPRASLDSSLMHPSRRQIRLLRVFVDRRGVSKNGEEGEGSLSIQIARYNEDLVDRLETWERNARRRNRVFGALDPSAPSPIFPSTKKRDGTKRTLEGKDSRKVSKGEKDAKRAQLKEEHEEIWKECEKQNYNHKEVYDRKMRQHGNDTGVGQWGVNILAEKDRLRAFDWGDEDVTVKQLESIALVSESGRVTLTDAKATRLLSNAGLTERREKSQANTSIVRYIYEPGNTQTTHSGANTPMPTWTKPINAKDTFNKIFRKTKLDRNETNTSLANASATSPSYTTSSDTSQSRSTNEPISPATSEEFLSASSDTGSTKAGLILDADREVQFRILLGRTGATHSRLPDMLSAGYIWMIPSFETPILKGEKKPRKGQVVKCQFGMGEIDFRKGKKSAPLMGGGDVRSVTIEFEWVEVGWHEEDDEDEQEEN